MRDACVVVERCTVHGLNGGGGVGDYKECKREVGGSVVAAEEETDVADCEEKSKHVAVHVGWHALGLMACAGGSTSKPCSCWFLVPFGLRCGWPVFFGQEIGFLAKNLKVMCYAIQCCLDDRCR